MKKLVTACGMIIFMALVFTGVNQYWTKTTASRGQLLASNVYKGEMETMDASCLVVIDEADRGKMYRQVHLDMDDGSSISGHDFESDGEWDRIFFCGQHPLVKAVNPKTLGCNSVLRHGMGWKFIPNPNDEGNVVPFSPETIRFAIRELDAAMSQVHNQRHLTYMWKWDEKEKKGVETWPNQPAS